MKKLEDIVFCSDCDRQAEIHSLGSECLEIVRRNFMMKIKAAAPKEYPYEIGTGLRYLGDRGYKKLDDEGSPTLHFHKGVIVEIVEVHEGRQGTGLYMMEDDEGNEVYDLSDDGYSVFAIDGVIGHCIFANDTFNWEITKAHNADKKGKCPHCGGGPIVSGRAEIDADKKEIKRLSGQCTQCGREIIADNSDRGDK